MQDATKLPTLEVQVIPTSFTSLLANMVLVKGPTHAVLVDVPFSRADAHRVVAEILDSGRSLQTIFITHDHPDHFFGLDVLNDAFPDAAIVADPTVATDLIRSVPIKFERWSAQLGTNAPRRQMLAAPLQGGQIMLDGQVLKVIGPMQGDHKHSTCIWIPSIGTLIAADIVFNGLYPWLGEHGEPEYAAWLASLDAIEALDPAVLIAGHRRPGEQDDRVGIDFTRRYIRAFASTAKTVKTSGELARAMEAMFPGTVDVAGGFLLGVSSQVGVGEIAPWDE